MANTNLNKNYTAEAAILPFTIVKFGATDGAVLQAAAATDKLVGVCEAVGPLAGERCDVVKVGIADVVLGGTVARGDAISSNASGQGIATATVGNRIIGIAETSGVAGDIIPVLLSPGIY